MKKGGKFFVFSWYFFVVVLALDLLLGFIILGTKPYEAIGMMIGSVWSLWFLMKVKELVEGK
ncbi:hypothetical protein J7J37_00475 [bacterium]|nr:hypothetical protein [bacterium]